MAMPAVNIDIVTGALTVGTTAIGSGTSGRVLYNNGGTLGEMTTTGSGTVLALATGPTFPTSITVGAAAGATGTVVLTGTTSGAVTLSTADAAGTWTMKLPTSAGTSGYFLKTDGSGNTSWDAAGGGLTVGTTTITSGTSTRILYNNGGVLGEYTLTGTGTVVAMQTAPTLTGPVVLNGAVGSSGLTITGATQTASFPALNITQTWNNVAVAFTGALVNITNTASATTSKLFDFQVGSSSIVSATRAGAIRTVNNGEGFTVNVSGQPAVGFGRNTTIGGLAIYGDGVADACTAGFNSNGLLVAGTLAIGFTNGAVTQAFDVKLTRDAAGTLALRNSTNAQTFRVYNTYTDASNGEWWTSGFASNVYRMGTTKNGTGTARVASWDYGGTTTAALSVPAAITGAVVIAGGAVGATTAITLGGATQTATSGTYIVTQTTGTFNPSSTSTMVAVQSYIHPTINYSAGTPGAGSYEALKIAAVETALPTGTNYLIRASAGATGFTDKFLVRNNGAIYSADTVLHHSIAALTDGAGASAGTITNAPSVGNPTKWIPIDDNGTTRYIPAW